MRIPWPWLKLLRDAPFFLIWHKTQSRWHGFHHWESPGVPDNAPIVLLVHPGVDTWAGMGEAIVWLEKWHASGKALSCNSAHDHGSAAGPKCPLPDTLSQTSLAHTYTKKRHVSSVKLGVLLSQSDEEPEFMNDVPGTSTAALASVATPLTMHSTIMTPSVAHHLRSSLTNVSDDEPKFIEGSSSMPLKSKKTCRLVIELDDEGQEVIDLTDL